MGEVLLEMDVQDLSEIRISDCLGHFKCWTKNPGICTIDDASRDITRKMMSGDLLVFLTPMVFGGYSYHLKKAVDRLIPNVLPFFERIDGEIHHAKR